MVFALKARSLARALGSGARKTDLVVRQIRVPCAVAHGAPRIRLRPGTVCRISSAAWVGIMMGAGMAGRFDYGAAPVRRRAGWAGLGTRRAPRGRASALTRSGWVCWDGCAWMSRCLTNAEADG